MADEVTAIATDGPQAYVMRLPEWIVVIPFRRLVWILPLALGIHELEEWNVWAWEQASFDNPPRSSQAGVRMTLLIVTIAGIAWTLFACRLPTLRATAHAAILGFGFVLFGNGIQHLYWQVSWGAYAPGSVTSLFVGMPSVLLVIAHARTHSLIDRWLVCALVAIWLAMLVGIAQSGRTFPAAIHWLHGVGQALADRLL